jgi:hypothetical protein
LGLSGPADDQKSPRKLFQIGTFRRGDRRLRPWKAENRPRGRAFGRYGCAIKGFCRISRTRNGRAPNMVLEADEATSVGAIRQREWRARRRANRRQRCGCCEAIFTPARSDQAFCSSACRQRGYRRRKASGEMASSRPPAPPWRVSAVAWPPRRPPGRGPRPLPGPLRAPLAAR